MIEIDKSVPIPEVTPKTSRVEARYPWKQMEVGDSFLVPTDGKNGDKPDILVKQFQSRCSGIGKAYGMKFRVAMDDAGKVRCWRVE